MSYKKATIPACIIQGLCIPSIPRIDNMKGPAINTSWFFLFKDENWRGEIKKKKKRPIGTTAFLNTSKLHLFYMVVNAFIRFPESLWQHT